MPSGRPKKYETEEEARKAMKERQKNYYQTVTKPKQRIEAQIRDEKNSKKRDFIREYTLYIKTKLLNDDEFYEKTRDEYLSKHK